MGIDAVRFGEADIDGKTYYSDVLVYWDGSFELKAKPLHIDVQEFTDIIKKGPEVVVIGTGIQGSLPVFSGIKDIAREKKIRLLLERSTDAVEVFNGLVANGKKAAAFIHTTG